MGGSGTAPVRRRRRVVRYAVALVAATTLAACGGQDQEPKAQPGSATTAPSSSSAGSASSSGVPAPPPAKPLPRYEMARPAQCFRATAAQLRSTVSTAAPVDCSRQHTTVAAYTGLVKPAVTAQTPTERRLHIAQRLCLPAFRRAVGGSESDRAMTLLGWTMFNPSAEQLARGARWVRCDVFAQSGSELVPLPEKLPLLGSGIPEQLRVCQDGDGRDISCGRPHVYRVEKVFPVSSYPGPAYQRQARDRCDALMGRGGYWQPPSRQGWAAGDHFVRCLSKKG